ncbi:hypothetical protein CRU99_02300 [Malaciobacter mytili]|uniref:hypothetical protein n=1 Tax=Malaciobacter mytili TaxID=603050 RepID=UPI00100C2D34|nr:hypothetical protein [Malaciobacter mytili]RXI47481.1 hypothetical protein CRU99_02300 [Malaciobacter mytili]
MLDKKQLLQEIETTYKNHKKIKEILKDFEYGINLNNWAYQFTKEDFGKNIELSRKLFHFTLSNASEFRDYIDFAKYISKNDGLSDNELAKEAYKLALSKVTLLRDLRNLADILALKKDSFYDKDMAKEVYKEALLKTTSPYDYLCIAESLCNKDMLNDKVWAKEVYKLAIKASSNSDDLEAIAQSVALEENLDDEEWSNKIFSMDI